MKIVKSFEKSGLFIKRANKISENETEEQKGGFLGMLLSTLGASLLGNQLAGKEVIGTSCGQRVIRAGEGETKARQDFNPTSSFQ